MAAVCTGLLLTFVACEPEGTTEPDESEKPPLASAPGDRLLVVNANLRESHPNWPDDIRAQDRLLDLESMQELTNFANHVREHVPYAPDILLLQEVIGPSAEQTAKELQATLHRPYRAIVMGEGSNLVGPKGDDYKHKRNTAVIIDESRIALDRELGIYNVGDEAGRRAARGASHCSGTGVRTPSTSRIRIDHRGHECALVNHVSLRLYRSCCRATHGLGQARRRPSWPLAFRRSISASWLGSSMRPVAGPSRRHSIVGNLRLGGPSPPGKTRIEIAFTSRIATRQRSMVDRSRIGRAPLGGSTSFSRERKFSMPRGPSTTTLRCSPPDSSRTTSTTSPC